MPLNEDQVEQLQFYSGRIALLLANPQPELECWTSCLRDRIIELGQVMLREPPQANKPKEPSPDPQSDFFAVAKSIVEAQAERCTGGTA